jgi:uncharacterized protein YjbI with pentapeptide repeats
MKRYLQPFTLFLAFWAASLFSVNAQVITANDSVFMGAQYANDVYYSLKRGILKSVNRNEWDLAFQVESFEGGIRVNEMKGFELYLPKIDYEEWETIQPKDTAGQLTPANRLYNSDTAWSYGAFNATKIRDDDADYGWGKYDMGTHALKPNKFYFLKFPDKSVKKVRVLGIKNGFKNFQIEAANLDGSDLKTIDFPRENFKDRNFGYYTFSDNQFKDLEPHNLEWDLVFTRYNTTVRGQKYPVVGVLTNSMYSRGDNKWRRVNTAKVTRTSLNNEDFSSRSFTHQINTIGSDWKNFVLEQNQWVITDSLIYFVQDTEGSYWKLIFTGFTGSSNGGSYFYKKLLRPAGINESKPELVKAVYPNPTPTNEIFIQTDNNQALQVQIADLTGKTVLQTVTDNDKVMLHDIPAGLYLLTVTDGTKKYTAKIIVQ